MLRSNMKGTLCYSWCLKLCLLLIFNSFLHPQQANRHKTFLVINDYVQLTPDISVLATRDPYPYAQCLLIVHVVHANSAKRQISQLLNRLLIKKVKSTHATTPGTWPWRPKMHLLPGRLVDIASYLSAYEFTATACFTFLRQNDKAICALQITGVHVRMKTKPTPCLQLLK